MTRWTLLLGVLAGVVWAGSAWAQQCTAGDMALGISTCTWTETTCSAAPCAGAGLCTAADECEKTTRGPWKQTSSVFLCDLGVAASLGCQIVDLQDLAGVPDTIVFQIKNTTTCTGNPTATFSTCTDALGTECFNLASSTSIQASGTSQLVYSMPAGGILNRYLRTTLSGMTSCTDLEVVMHTYERNP